MRNHRDRHLDRRFQAFVVDVARGLELPAGRSHRAPAACMAASPSTRVGRVMTPRRSTIASISTSPPPTTVGAGSGGSSAALRRGGMNRGAWRTLRGHDDGQREGRQRKGRQRRVHRMIVYLLSTLGLHRFWDGGRKGRRIAGRERRLRCLVHFVELLTTASGAPLPRGTSSSRAATCIPDRQALCRRQSGRTPACRSRACANARNRDDPRHLRARDA